MAKGKGHLEVEEAPRTGRVKVPEPSNAYLLQKHSLTLIGRVINPSVQKIWSLIPFFTDKWSTEVRPVGSDLGQGKFQFQFQNEEDLLAVLEKRPYVYAHWMVIVQRWEPTTSPEFPSVIPFWIKVQGIPVHLWTEETVRYIGKDIGSFEEADITSLTVRMRVHVNGRLPLIKSTVVEYPNGDEVIATLLYEKLEKHCTYCNRLDHGDQDCLKAKADKREAQASLEDKPPERPQQMSSTRRNDYQEQRKSNYSNSSQVRRTETGIPSRRPSYDNHDNHHYPLGEQPRRSYPRQEGSGRGYNQRNQMGKRYHPYQQQRYEVRADNKNRSPHNQVYKDNNSKAHDENHIQYRTGLTPRSGRAQSGPTKDNDRQEESSASKAKADTPNRGTPLQLNQDVLPREAIAEAIEEIREVMNQYTACADPTESAARKQRLRDAEKTWEFE